MRCITHTLAVCTAGDNDSELHLVSLASPPGGQSLKTEDNNMHGSPFEMAVKACLMASDACRKKSPFSAF